MQKGKKMKSAVMAALQVYAPRDNKYVEAKNKKLLKGLKKWSISSLLW